MKTSLAIIFSSLFLLAACTGSVSKDAPITTIKKHETRHYGPSNQGDFIGLPQPDNFTICHEHSCAMYTHISLSDQQWEKVRSLFSPVAVNAVEERSQISQAIALLERFTGKQAGTSGDRAENFPGLGMQGQMDCVDESTNTTVYLRMLQNSELLHWHQPSSRVSRGFFTGLFSMPHSTAVIQEEKDLKEYAVDSWYLANGEPPFIVPLDEWKAGWAPK